MSGKPSDTDGRRTTALPTRWFLLTGNRLLVSFVVLLGVGALFVAAGLLGLATVTTPTRVMWYLNGTVNGLLTLVPIAVGVNQIILTHEFGSLRDLHRRRSDVTGFRERIGRQTGTTLSSPDTSTFFGRLLGAVSEAAEDLQRDPAQEDAGAMDEVETVARSIGEHADGTRERLEAGEPGMFRTLVVMLDYDDSRHFDEVRRLRHEAPARADTIAERHRIENRLDDIEGRFVDVDTARQYLKTVVVERQLARLSRLLVYTGVPAVSVAVLGIFTYRDVAGLALPHALSVVAVGALVVATLSPLVVLGVYILRVATIAGRTAAFGPFVS